MHDGVHGVFLRNAIAGAGIVDPPADLFEGLGVEIGPHRLHHRGIGNRSLSTDVQVHDNLGYRGIRRTFAARLRSRFGNWRLELPAESPLAPIGGNRKGILRTELTFTATASAAKRNNEICAVLADYLTASSLPSSRYFWINMTSASNRKSWFFFFA